MSNVHATLGKYILADGEPIVLDLDNSFGCYVFDKVTGKKYLDCSSQYASMALGWNHPKLVEISDWLGKIALHKVSNSDYYTEILSDFVEKFASIATDFSHFFFIEGGALAVENSIKAAFDWKVRKLGYSENNAPNDLVDNLDVIHLEQSFHGRSGYTLSLTNTIPNKVALFPKFQWTRIKNPKIKFPMVESEIANNRTDEEFSLIQAEEALKNKCVAAIILETIQSEGGDNHFSPSYFAELRMLADKYEAMLILDEVQTGVGLTGKMWGYEHFGIIPDMISFGKKTQVCGFASTNRINSSTKNVFNVSSRISSTWGGNIVDMARFSKIIDIIKEDNLLQNTVNVGDYFLQELQKLPTISNIRGKGLMLAFDLEDKQKRDEVLQKLLQHMLILPCGQRSIRVRPSLIFSKEYVDEAISYIKKAIMA